MPQRAAGIMIAVAGVFFVTCLILLRFNLQTAARTGPKWKRSLVLAGIFILSSLGLFSASAGGSGCVTTMCYHMEYVPTPEERERQAHAVEVEKTLERLSIRMGLLEKYISSEKLDREVVRAVIANIEKDIAVIRENMSLLPETDREKAGVLLKKAGLQLRLARAQLIVSEMGK